MNEDELTERLASTLRQQASTVTSPPDAWERFSAAATGAPSPVVPLRRRVDRRVWLGAPAGALGIAALIALVALVVHNGGSTNVKASSSAASSPLVAAGPAASGRAGASGVAGAAAPGAAGPGAAGPQGTASNSSGSSAAVPGAASASPAPTTFGPAGGPVPAGFAPTSVTFVSPTEGWVLGTAPCGSPPCTSIVRTTDAGASWVGIPAPVDGLSPGGEAAGVSEIRFATPMDGWVFGPDLWATHDGGATWHRVALDGGAQVSALEASAGRVWAAVLDDTSAQVRVYGSPVGSDAWAAEPVNVPIGAGPVPATQIVLQGSTGWLVQVDRTVIGGARLVNGRWTSWTPPCATVVGPAALAASSPSDLVAACDVGLWGGTAPPAERLYVSRDGGGSFSAVPGNVVPTGGGSVVGVASRVAGSVVVASGGSLYASSDGGATWAVSFHGQETSWRDLGFTTASQGVAVGSGSQMTPVLLMSGDGGHHWSAVRF